MEKKSDQKSIWTDNNRDTALKKKEEKKEGSQRLTSTISASAATGPCTSTWNQTNVILNYSSVTWLIIQGSWKPLICAYIHALELHIHPLDSNSVKFTL